jgi:ribosomal protein S18 acetylase RimI-like enzyme
MTAKVSFRLMTEADVSATTLVRRSAIAWLERTQVWEPAMSPPQRPIIQDHFLRTDPEGCWVAELDGLVMGYAQAWVRGDVWSLAQLFVQPEAHGHGLGEGALARAAAYAEARGARVRCVVASSSPVAHALYVRQGMLAAALGYRLSGPVDVLRAQREAASGQRGIVADIDALGPDEIARLIDGRAPLDRELWGAERRQDHALFLDAHNGFEEQAATFTLLDGSQPDRGALLGYGYAQDDGWFGMLAAREPALQLPLMRMTGDWLAERGVERAHCYVLSHNATVMTALVGAGWRIDGWSYFLTSAPFGHFDRYVPSGGMLL